jgi:hypothetical protein
MPKDLILEISRPGRRKSPIFMIPLRKGKSEPALDIPALPLSFPIPSELLRQMSASIPDVRMRKTKSRLLHISSKGNIFLP